jgi:hypothetical protein
MVFASYGLFSFWVYWPALGGDFISDDSFYVVGPGLNYALNWDFVLRAFDPWGDLKYEAMAYSPLYAIVSRVEWALFETGTLGYHIVNVIAHTFNSMLVAILIRQQGFDRYWALVGGAFFAMHPANVEAVAWINQLRSALSLTGGLLSLVLLRRHPKLAALCFVSGLLFKVSSAFVLPIALGLYWSGRGRDDEAPISLPWLGLWVAALLLCVYPALDSTAVLQNSHYDGVPDLLRNIAANGARYVLMATTSIGVSAFHAPPPVRSWSNSWWLASLPIAAVLMWRIVHAIRNRSPELGFWLGAGMSFGMVSQIFPFYFVIADRYIYFLLPGLLVAALFWARELEPRIRGLLSTEHSYRRFDTGLRAAAAIVIVVFAVVANARAELWTREGHLLLESTRNYPQGGPAYWARTILALQREDIGAAVSELQGVFETGYHRYVDVFALPYLRPFLGDARVVRLRHRQARDTIARFDNEDIETQHQLRAVASAYFYLGKHDLAIDRLETALRRGGPHRDAILLDLEAVRTARLAARSSN